MVSVATIPRYTLESGEELREVPLAYQTWGTLDDHGENVVVVGHSLTSSSDVGAWWAGLLGPGRALDTSRYFVICVNVVGSPYGSLSPITIDEAASKPYGPSLPQATVRDVVGMQKCLLDQLGVRRIAFAIGGSMGGMQALEWAYYGDYVRALVPIGVGACHSPWCIAFSEAQRQAIYADAAWQGGWYTADNPPQGGLAAARMIAMISYRSFGSFVDRFGRERVFYGGGAFQVEDYLRHHGQALVQRFDANCYVYLTRLMDTHDVARGRGAMEEVLRRIVQPTLVVGMQTDVLYTLAEQKELAEHIPDADLAVLSSKHGHDAFLIEQEELNAVVGRWRKASVDPLLWPG